MRRILMAVAVLALAACGQGNQATTTSSSEQSAAASSSAEAQLGAQPAEFDILSVLATYEAYQGQAASLAQARAQSQKAKDFAAARASEHDAAFEAIYAASRSAGVPPPSPGLDEDHRAYITMLMNAEGAQFDTTYASQEVLMATTTAGKLDAFIAANPNSPLAAWAHTKRTELQTILETARGIAR